MQHTIGVVLRTLTLSVWATGSVSLCMDLDWRKTLGVLFGSLWLHAIVTMGVVYVHARRSLARSIQD